MGFCDVFCVVPPAVVNEADDNDDVEDDEQSVAADGMSFSH